MTEFAEEYEYAPHAFDRAIGQQVPVKDRPGGRVIGGAVVTSTDGGGMTAEIILDSGTEPPVTGDRPAMSFAFRQPGALPRDILAAREPRIRWACSGRPEDPGQLRLADSALPAAGLMTEPGNPLITREGPGSGHVRAHRRPRRLAA